MKRLTFLTILGGTALISLSAHADIILNEVMTRDVQRTTGVANLSMAQKTVLENWLNQTFVLKTAAETTPAPAQVYLSINIDNGHKILLSDNSLWEISPDDVSTAATWLSPVVMQIKPSNNPDYPSLITDTASGTSVKARQIPNVTAPASNS